MTVFGVFVMSDCISLHTAQSQESTVQIWTTVKNIGAAVLMTGIHLALHGKKLIYPWTVLENSISMLASRKERMFSYAYIHTVYLWKLFFPFNLSYDYGYPCLPHQTSLSWTTAAVYLAVLALFAAALWQRNAVMLWSFALAVVPFIPASNIVFPIGTILAERLLYLPSMGFCLIITFHGILSHNDVKSRHSVSVIFSQLAEAVYIMAWFGSRFLSPQTTSNLYALYARVWHKTHHKRTKFWSRLKLIAKGIVFIALCAYLCWMAVKSFKRSLEWRTELTLFGSALSVCPTSLKVLNNYGSQFISGDPLHAIPYLGENAYD